MRQENSSRLTKWREPLPTELRSASVVLSERDLSTTMPVPLHGRCDQVFDNGRFLYVVDTKRRKKPAVYLRDVIQLSVYRVILERESQRLIGYHRSVSPTGYVRVTGYGTTSYLQVKLLTTTQVVALWNRYWELKTRKAAANPRVAVVQVCSACDQAPRCPRYQY